VHYLVTHRTTYAYSSDVTFSQHVARLRPRELPCQKCLAHDLVVSPVPTVVSERHDYFGNATSFFTLSGAHRELVAVARSKVDVRIPVWPVPTDTPAWDIAREPRDGDLAATEFIFPSPYVPALPALREYASPSFTPGRSLLDAALDLTRRIHEEFSFDPTATTVATPLEAVLQNRRGVCQDFAHLQIGCLRALGLPARYVSGYLETLPPPGKTKLIGADASHAWVQLYVPNFGWVDLDPTNNTLANGRHITVAWGRDFEDVCPIRGVIAGGGKHLLSVAVDVVPLSQVAEGADLS
jgi:transglutaminase-like putative cysteine protease